MNIIANNVAAKLFVAFVAASMLFTLATPSAKAATAEELQAQIAALMAQIAALSGGSSSAAACTFTRSLTVGSEGSDVKCLQDYLTPTYFSNAGGSTGYFGPVTAAAVAAWQTANGVSPAVGYFGPVSQAKYNALMAAVPPTTGGGTTPPPADDEDDTTSGTLGNDEGSITVSGASADESTLEEGQEGGVLAFDVDVEGDVEINRIDVYVAEDGTESEDAEDYFVRAFLMVDEEEVAELEVDEWDQDDYDVLGLSADDYRLRFSGLNLVFADGDEPEFQVGFEIVNNLDSADLTTDWDVELDSIRFVDGEGFSDSEDAIGEADTFGFDAEETADLDIQSSSDNPDATTLKIDDGDQESDEYEVFVFEMEENNGVDITIEDVRVTIAATVDVVDEALVVEEAILYADGTEVASESVPTGGQVDFEDIGVEVGGDETVDFSIGLIFKGSDDAGTNTSIQVTNVDILKAEDANGNDESDLTFGNDGTLDSEVHTLRTVVPVVSDTSFTNDRNENGSAGTISFEFTVGAEDDDFDLVFGDVAAVDGTADDVRFTLSGTDTTIALAAVTKVSGDATVNGTTGWTIADGDEATFVMDVTFTTAASGDNGTYRVTVDTVGGIEIDETSDGMSLTYVAP